MSNNAQGFWGISKLDDLIIKVNGTPLSVPTKAMDYPSIDSDFIIVEDDGGNDVLILQSLTLTTLTMASSGVDYPVIGEQCEYIGGHPPHRPK